MNSWQKPITTRRYLQPPKSEKFYTLWAEGKLVFGDIEAAGEEQDIYDLTGRKIEKITAPGIYIINKKKVIVRNIE